MDQPLRPGAGTLPSRPGAGNRPNRPGDGGLPNRPGGGNRPNRPGDGVLPDRPGNGDRPGIVNRPGSGNRGNFSGNFSGNDNRTINIGEINAGNNAVISQRPAWANIDNNRISSINNRWQGQIGGIRNWQTRHPDRIAGWRGWGDGVRNRWPGYGHRHNWFDGSWWNGHRHRWCGWHYGYRFRRHSWGYWWRVPTFAACVGWFTWSAPATVWAEPVYYDYGTGGNVVYQDNSVYIDNQLVASSEEFAQSAAALATVEPPASQEVAEQAEWMPLGTFAVSSSQKDVDPTRVIQLAVNREGIISGTMYNTTTDQAQSIQGQVDSKTQRVAFRIGESENVVVETGLYNLTQNDVPVLVHLGSDQTEQWLLVRMEEPKSADEDPSGSQPAAE